MRPGHLPDVLLSGALVSWRYAGKVDDWLSGVVVHALQTKCV